MSEFPENPESVPYDFSEYRGYLTEPFGPVAILCHSANTEFVSKVNRILSEKRERRKDENSSPYVNNPGYLRRDYVIDSEMVRFSTGEGKVALGQTVRGHDLFIITDVLAHEAEFPVFGETHFASPDDHIRDLLRLISVATGKARRITVIMPFLYEGRQDLRRGRESLDCAYMLKQLYSLGVSNLIVFDPHDERIVNAVPLMSMEMPKSSYKIIDSLLSVNPTLRIDPETTLVVTPDEMGAARAVFYSSFMELPLGIFYRQRDYTKEIDGENPVKELLFLGDDYTGKNILIIDDMINTGKTMLETARNMKKNGAGDIYCLCPFGLFTTGTADFDEAYEQGTIKQVHCTNLIHRPQSVLDAPWYVDVDMTPFVARLIDAINLDESLSKLINPSDRITELLSQIRIGELFSD